MYVDRIIQSNPNFVVNSLNIHRLLITAVMVSAKILDDLQPKSEYFANLGGVDVKELQTLERNLLSLLDFHVMVDPDVLFSKYQELLAIPVA